MKENTRIVVLPLIVYGKGYRPSYDGMIITENGDKRDIRYEDLEYSPRSEKKDGNMITQIQQRVFPKIGSFQCGDTVILKTKIRFNDNPNKDYKKDILDLTRPTKYVTFRVVFEEEPRTLTPVVVEKSEFDPVSSQYSNQEEFPLQIQHHGDRRICEFIDFYPHPDTQYVLNWTANF